MASIKKASNDSTENSDLSAVQQLIFSIGHLKFSLRAISSMHLQSALLSQKESEPLACLRPMESNTLLENVMHEVLSNKSDQSSQSPVTCKTKKVTQSISIDDLELVQAKLLEELETRRKHYLTSMSNKLKQ